MDERIRAIARRAIVEAGGDDAIPHLIRALERRSRRRRGGSEVIFVLEGGDVLIASNARINNYSASGMLTVQALGDHDTQAVSTLYKGPHAAGVYEGIIDAMGEGAAVIDLRVILEGLEG